tara:strand:+ start:2057 stop:3775 length:1719 start_codon:yes stop_codon:yes gene_type:complete
MIISSLKKLSIIINKNLRFLILSVFVCSIFSVFFETLSIGMVIPMISALTEPDYVNNIPILGNLSKYLINQNNNGSAIFSILIILSIIFSLKIIFVFLSTYLKLQLIHRFNSDIQQKLYKKYINLSWVEYLEKKSSKMIRNIQNETSIVKNKIVDALIIIFVETLLFISIFTLLLFTIPKFTLLIVFTIILIGGIFYKNSRDKIRYHASIRLSAGAKIFNYIIESLTSFKDILIYNKQDFFRNKFNIQNLIYHNSQKKLGLLNSYPRIFLEALGYISVICIIYFSIISEITTSQLLTTLGLFIIAVSRLIPSISRLITAIQNLNEGQIALEVIYEEISENNIKEDKSLTERSNVKFDNNICLKNISFKYPNSKNFVLENVNLKIKKFSTNAIYGVSGSGKSTLVDIISGLLHQYNGEITIDEKKVHNIKKFWKNSISYVGQKNYLFSETIAKNIALESEDNMINKKKITDILKICRLEKFNLESKVEEMGKNLSGGESQRISIARAMYNEPSFLIFDEATNSLDKKVEKEILDLLISLKNKVTIILISHDTKVVDYCENIYEIKNKTLNKLN